MFAGVVIGLFLGVGVTSVMAQDDKNERGEVVIEEELASTRNAPEADAQVSIMAEGDNAFMGKVRFKPGATVAEHTDESEEYLYVLSGTGTLTVNGTEYGLKPNTAVYMPAGARVSFENDDKLFEAVQVFAGPGPANKYSKWETGASMWKPQRGTRSRDGSESSGDGATIDM